MDVASRRIANALKTAIRREERTAAAYMTKAEEMKNPEAKKLLEGLAKQEQAHGRKLQMVLDKEMDLSRLGKGGKRAVLGLQVVNDDVRKMEQTSEAILVIRRALRSEENSTKLYRSLENIYMGLDLGELFGKLAVEEEKHAARLSSLLANMQWS